MNIPGLLKIGNNSLYLGGVSNDIPGTLNEIYTDGTGSTAALKIQSNAGNVNNTVMNQNGGKVVIGDDPANIPQNIATNYAKLFVKGDIYATGSITSQSASLFLGTSAPYPGQGFLASSNYLSINNGLMQVALDFSPKFLLDNQGRMAIGNNASIANDYNLKVDGKTFLNGNTDIKGDVIITNGTTGNIKFKPNGFAKITGDSSKISILGKLAIGDNSITRPESFYVVGNSNFQGDVEVSGRITALTGISVYDFDGNEIKLEKALTYANNGNVGIGTGTSTEKLEVVGKIKANGLIIPTNAALGKVLTSDALGNASWNNLPQTQWITNGNNISYNTGNVGIGTNSVRDFKLSVEGKIRARGIKTDVLSWSDFVFNKNHKLKSLYDVEKQLLKDKHFENIPSENEVLKNGIEHTEVINSLLKNVEESYLYIIQLKKEIDELKTKISKK